ncbi:MAG: hypothetical protein ACREJQ_06260 [bacterium]
MTPVAGVLVKTGLVYLIVGLGIGVVSMGYFAFRGSPLSYAWIVVHSHFLLVGWLIQFAFGVWLLLFPRPKEIKVPVTVAYVGYYLVNGVYDKCHESGAPSVRLSIGRLRGCG